MRPIVQFVHIVFGNYKTKQKLDFIGNYSQHPVFDPPTWLERNKRSNFVEKKG